MNAVEERRKARFEHYVQRTDSCWLWKGGLSPTGYGMFRVGKVQTGAHRWAWQWANGPIPEDMQVHHICHTRHCVNPAHLSVMTRRQNLQNRIQRSWDGIDAGVEPDAEPLTVTLTPKHSAWVRARIAQTGENPDELVARAMYRYMARWHGKWRDTSE